MQRRSMRTPALVKTYIDLFVNRRAYTLQSMRPNPESGRHYYYRPKDRDSGGPLLPTDKTIYDHLQGKTRIGLYAINPQNQRCKWVAIDADYASAMDDLIKLQYQLTQDRVESALEMSKRGGHPWIFLAVPLLAKKCRIYIYDLAQKLGVESEAIRFPAVRGSIQWPKRGLEDIFIGPRIDYFFLARTPLGTAMKDVWRAWNIIWLWALSPDGRQHGR